MAKNKQPTVADTGQDQLLDSELTRSDAVTLNPTVHIPRADLEELLKEVWIARGKDPATAEAIAVMAAQNMDRQADPKRPSVSKIEHVLKLVGEGKIQDFAIACVHTDYSLGFITHLGENRPVIGLVGSVSLLHATLHQQCLFGPGP